MRGGRVSPLDPPPPGSDAYKRNNVKQKMCLVQDYRYCPICIVLYLEQLEFTFNNLTELKVIRDAMFSS